MSDLIVKTADESFDYSPTLKERRDAMLAEAALIGRVRNAEENAMACKVVEQLHALESAVEDARVILTEPHLKAQRQLMALKKEFCSDVSPEKKRLNTLCGNWKAMEDAKDRDAKA